VAVRADCGIIVASSDRFLMDAIQDFVVLILVALLARCIERKRHFSQILRCEFGMWEGRDIGMAIYTSFVLFSMNRGIKQLGIYGQGKSFSTGEAFG
jgi:hypothetical protein